MGGWVGFGNRASALPLKVSMDGQRGGDRSGLAAPRPKFPISRQRDFKLSEPTTCTPKAFPSARSIGPTAAWASVEIISAPRLHVGHRGDTIPRPKADEAATTLAYSRAPAERSRVAVMFTRWKLSH